MFNRLKENLLPGEWVWTLSLVLSRHQSQLPLTSLNFFRCFPFSLGRLLTRGHPHRGSLLSCAVLCPAQGPITLLESAAFLLLFDVFTVCPCMQTYRGERTMWRSWSPLLCLSQGLNSGYLRGSKSPHPPSHLSDTDFLLSLGLLPNLSSPVDTFLVNPESWTVSPSHWATTSVPEGLFGFRDSTSPASNLGSFCFQFLNMLKQSHLDWHLQFFPCFGLKSLLQQGAGTLGIRCFHYLKSIVLKIA